MERFAAQRHAWALFLAAHAALVEAVEAALRQAGMPELAWYDVLWTLERAEARRLRMHELAQRLVVTRSNVSRLVDRLEAAGLVRRERCEDDRRGHHAILTDAGARTRKRMWPVYRRQIDRLFGRHVGEAEARTLGDAFARVVRELRATGS